MSVSLDLQYAVNVILEGFLKVKKFVLWNVLKAEDFVEPKVDVPIRPWRLALLSRLQFGGSFPNQFKVWTVIIP